MARRDKTEHRFLNSDEMESMGFTELKANDIEEGWPYPDTDDVETTECYRISPTRCRRSGRRLLGR